MTKQEKDITGRAAPTGARIRLADAVPLQAPLIVQIFNIYVCNLSCWFCHFGLPREKRPKLTTKAVMALGLYKKIIDDMKVFPTRLKLLRFCGAGESLLDRNIVEMVRYAVDSGVAERVELITNGILLTPEMSTALISAGLTQIRISIYGMSSQKYREACGAEVDFDQIVRNVKFFWAEKQRLGGPRVYVKTMNCVLDGERDAAEFIRLFGDCCDVYAVESVVPNVQGVDYSAWLKDGTPDYNALGVKLPPIQVCPQPYHLLTICPDGRVVPCSNESMAGVGDCNRESLTDIWRGTLLRQCQRKMLDGSVAYGGVCATCSIVQCRPFPEDILDQDAERLKVLFDGTATR